MAIIPEVPHVKVDVVVDGRALPEYLDEDDDDSISSDSTIKYVESTTGSKFSIRTSLAGLGLRDLEEGDSMIVDTHLDGKMVDSAVKKFPLDGYPSFEIRGVRYREGGLWKQRDFMFAELVTTEIGATSKPRPELKDLGTITVKLHVGLTEKRQREKSQRDSNIPTIGHENIHEKHLKGQAISQQAKLGDATLIHEITPRQVRYMHYDEPFATFHFRYRSRIQTRREEQITIKRELKRERVEDDESDDDLIVVSSRPPASKLKTSVNVDTGVETIDLTDD
ncbi:hypothetical protein E4T39_06405 [Aureobasidium subglaciale]|nr:hypothetical protein E4T39_06405 [Aureobasidium subglaciale]